MREAASATEGAPAGSASRKRGVVGGDTDVRAAILTDGARTRARRRRCTRLHARCVGELEARYTRTPKPHSKPHKGNVGRVTDGRPAHHICLQVCQCHGKPPIEIAKQCAKAIRSIMNYFRRLASIPGKKRLKRIFLNMKRPIEDSGDDEAGESNNDELDDLVEDDAADGSRGRVRCVWTAELHDKFEAAIQAIGMEKAKPMGILMHMGVTGITKANIKSHLQKYRGKVAARNKVQEEALVGLQMLGGTALPNADCSATASDTEVTQYAPWTFACAPTAPVVMPALVALSARISMPYDLATCLPTCLPLSPECPAPVAALLGVQGPRGMQPGLDVAKPLVEDAGSHSSSSSSSSNVDDLALLPLPTACAFQQPFVARVKVARTWRMAILDASKHSAMTTMDRTWNNVQNKWSLPPKRRATWQGPRRKPGPKPQQTKEAGFVPRPSAPIPEAPTPTSAPTPVLATAGPISSTGRVLVAAAPLPFTALGTTELPRLAVAALSYGVPVAPVFTPTTLCG